MKAMRIRKDDLVEVIAGESAQAGRPRRVMKVFPKDDRVVVEGVNLVYKHLKPNRRNAQGGRLSKEAPIHISNVMIFCKVCNHGVRTGVAYDEGDGRKYMFCKSCKKGGRTTVIRYLSKAREAYAK